VDATGLLGKRFYLQAFTALLSFFTLRGTAMETEGNSPSFDDCALRDNG
jgi:hypothetical protein